MSIIVIEGSNGVGKTTLIRELEKKYDFVSAKSIPNWYRAYIEYARTLEPESQKRIYLMGHQENYYSFEKEKDYILDRFFYSTIVRLNYELKKTIEETLQEISQIEISPDVIIYLKANKNLILSRISNRENFLFDENFFSFENEIYKRFGEKCDKVISIENNENYEHTIHQIENSLEKRKVFLKRR